ncbi:PspC domain-containing protein [Clostridium sp. MSJ-4]|uniref:PspC domain-containing protein n=1 Tax=Clostridium simiarum TaxID=2841506 RepID=A0ABS6F5U7_9CLOT|nr:MULTISPECIES: PspC domain-containing protein [Clostridium]MBU5592882.1 PspC domain-containing protein [Clostridium simiarum]
MSNNKRLYKIKEQSMISGVCAGTAEYLSIDVSIVRLVWLALGFFWFTGVILYIAAAAILPDKKDLVNRDPNFNKPFEDVDYYETKSENKGNNNNNDMNS